MTDTHTTTTPDSVISHITQQLRDRKAALLGEAERIDQALQALDAITWPIRLAGEREIGEFLDARPAPAAAPTSDSARYLAPTVGSPDIAAHAAEATSSNGSARSRTRRSKAAPQVQTLHEAAIAFLRANGPASVSTIADAVLARGYETNSGNFRQSVSVMLSKRDAFKRNGDGLWTLTRKAGA